MSKIEKIAVVIGFGALICFFNQQIDAYIKRILLELQDQYKFWSMIVIFVILAFFFIKWIAKKQFDILELTIWEILGFITYKLILLTNQLVYFESIVILAIWFPSLILFFYFRFKAIIVSPIAQKTKANEANFDRVLSTKNLGFSTDKPITNEYEDAFNRSDMAKEIAKLLTNTAKETSFSLGIYGEWGSGKTSFLNILKNRLKEEDKDAIIIDFNPWRYASTDGFIEAFFDELSKRLNKYSFRLSLKFKQYVKFITTQSNNFILNTISFYIKESPEQIFNEIQEEIKKIGKNIYIFIDDLDRLDKNEILATLKLIRNVAYFNRLTFITAYDKAYVKNILKEKGEASFNTFTEKFFDTEFALPGYDKNELLDMLVTEVKKILPEGWITSDLNVEFNILKSLDKIIQNPDFFNTTEYHIPTILNKRKVLNIINSIKLFYSRLGKEIDYEQLLKLELFRVTYPLIYLDLFNNKDNYLEYDRIYYKLKLKEDTNNNNEEQFDKNKSIKNYLTEKAAKLKINSGDIDIIIQFLNILFSMKKNELAISNPTRFYLYNQASLGNAISEVEFSKTIEEKKLDALQNLIGKHLENSNNLILKHELNEKFASHRTNIQEEEQFKTLFSGFIYFVNKYYEEYEIWSSPKNVDSKSPLEIQTNLYGFILNIQKSKKEQILEEIIQQNYPKVLPKIQLITFILFCSQGINSERYNDLSEAFDNEKIKELSICRKKEIYEKLFNIYLANTNITTQNFHFFLITLNHYIKIQNINNEETFYKKIIEEKYLKYFATKEKAQSFLSCIVKIVEPDIETKIFMTKANAQRYIDSLLEKKTN